MLFSAEQFLQFADLVPEPTLLVSTDGIICAVNRAFCIHMPGWPKRLQGQRLIDWVEDTSSEVLQYLSTCSRTRDLLPGSLILRCESGITLPCRCSGAVLVPRFQQAPALVQLRLLPKAEAPSQFLLLTQRINALTAEVAARKQAEADLQKRQVEVEALNLRLQRAVAETHHRVKNNLQAVISLLEMQKEDTADGLLPVESLNESLFQIKTIALVHDVLSHEGPESEVDVRRVLSNLVELLAASLRSAGKPAAIHLQAESVWLSTQAATALALVVNELVSNAYKHGQLFKGRPTNDGISVRLSLHDNEVVLEIEDCGTGFPADFDVTTQANLGLSLVQSLVENDLHGRLTFDTVAASEVHDAYPGGKVCVRFPASAKTE